MPLGAQDLDAILEFSLEAQSYADVQAFREGVLPGLRTLVPCDIAGYNEVDAASGTVIGNIDPADAWFDGVDERFSELLHEHPLLARVQAGDRRANVLSTFLTARQLHALELYQDIFRRMEVEDQIAFGLPGELIVGIIISRSRRNFSERDVEVAERVRPHLAQAYLAARERERLAALVDALETVLDEHAAALILLDRGSGVIHSSESARELLRAYFGHPPGNGSLLPWEVAEWLHGDGARPLVVAGPRGRLRIRESQAVGVGSRRVLVLDERRTCPPDVDDLRRLGVTRREAEVLRLLCCGKRTDQIAAELFISPATARKHLEHIFARLGVSSRAEAVAHVLSA
jgi:DNA-binding CsgD family transcriptional regulator